jgi:hypothetical protein
VYLFDYAKGIALKKWQLHDKPSLKVMLRPQCCGLVVVPHMTPEHCLVRALSTCGGNVCICHAVCILAMACGTQIGWLIDLSLWLTATWP